MEKVFAKPELLLSHRALALPGLRRAGGPADRSSSSSPSSACASARSASRGIGCYTAFPPIIDVDVMQALHGRAPSVATGVKRVCPTPSSSRCRATATWSRRACRRSSTRAARGERFTAIVLQQRGLRRDRRPHDGDDGPRPAHEDDRRRAAIAERHGSPIRISELVAQLDGAAYVARAAVHTAGGHQAGRSSTCAPRSASQLDGKGFSLVEILTMCPTDWFVEPTETPDWVERNFAPTYPLRVLKQP